MFKLVLEKAEEPEIKLPTFTGSSKKQEFQKNIYFCFTDYAKAFDCVDHNKLWKIQEMEYQTTWAASWETCMQVKKQHFRTGHGTTDWFQIRKGVHQGYICHAVYLTYMQVISRKLPNWIKHKLESSLLGESSITSDMEMPPTLGRKWRRTKEPPDESERGAWKIWLKTQHSKNEYHGIWSHHFMANRWGNDGNSERLYFGGLQNHCRWWLLPWN